MTDTQRPRHAADDPPGPGVGAAQHRDPEATIAYGMYGSGGGYVDPADATVLIPRITDVPTGGAPSGSTTGASGGAATAGADRSADTDDPLAPMKTAKTGGVVRASVVMAVATLTSRATGFLSKVILLGALGIGIINDAYTIANTLPNIIFELLIGGVLTSVAIPLLSRARTDPDGGQGYTQRLMTMAFVGLLLATALAVLAAPLLTRLYLSGHDTTSDPELATQLAYLLLPQIFFYGIAALFGAILNTKEKFGTPAWAPVANNLVVIGVAFALIAMPGGAIDPNGTLSREQLLLLGIGTTAGIVLQALVMVPSMLRSGFRFGWRWGGDPRLLEAGRLMLWAVAYVLVSQVGYVVVTRVASGGIAGGVTVYAFTLLLFQLPYGILGVSILTAIMPRMSRHAAAGDLAAVKDDMSLANRLSTVALMPVAAAMIALSGALAYLAARYGAVSATDVMIIGGTLAALAVGLVPLAVTLVQMRVFYAMKDARTPTLINAVMVAVRVPLLLLCMNLRPDLIVPGLAAATSFSYLVGAVTGEIWLRARYGPMGTRRTLVTVGKMTIASAAGGIAGWAAAEYLLPGAPDSLWAALAEFALGGTIGLVVIVVVATALRVEELVPLRRRVLRMLGRGSSATRSDHATAPGAGGAGGTENSAAVVPPMAAMPPAGPTRGTLEGAGPRTATGATALPGAPAVPAGGRPASVPAPPPPRILRPTPKATPPVTVPSGPTPSGATPSDDAAATALVDDRTIRQADRAVPVAPGVTIGSRYRLVSLVTTDSHGDRFWRAKDTVLPRDMAVTLLPDNSATSATVARTLRAGRLHHIGLPQTLDVGTEQGQSYVVGQWVDGATLTDLLAEGPLEPNVAASITAKISEAVAEAHRNGIALGALHPTLIRVNFDGQVRLSHVIAHGSATPEQDIRAVGALLYVMLTGYWPLPDGGDSTGGTVFKPAPTEAGRELPVVRLRPQVPAALSALASRALHPEDPDGIHAVGAIASLLRQPDVAPQSVAAPGATPSGQPARAVRSLTPAERRLVKERRVKLGVAAVMLAAFTALIIIVVASLAKQMMESVADPAAEGLAPIASSATRTSTAPLNTGSASGDGSASSTGSQPATSSGSTSASSSVSSAAAAAPVKVIAGAVYDPQGEGKKDYEDLVDQAFDGDPSTKWPTWVYFDQFAPPAQGGLKEGVGLLLELEKPVAVNTVQVSTASPGIVVQIRSIPDGNVNTPLDQTKVIGSATLGSTDPVTIPTSGAPTSKYLVVFITQLIPVDGDFEGSIADVTVTGNP